MQLSAASDLVLMQFSAAFDLVLMQFSAASDLVLLCILYGTLGINGLRKLWFFWSWL